MLTEVAIRNAKPGDRERKLADGHGLYLSILPTGFKGWRWKYRYAGREKRLVIGPYPLISAKQARELRDEARRTLLQGIDPGAVKQVAQQRAKAGDTFEAVARTWHAAKARTLTPRYSGQVLTRLEANAFPQFGSMRLKEITPPIVLAAIRRIEKRGARTMAQEVRGHVSEVFVWAIAAGLAETDPAAIIRKALSPAPGGRRPAVLAIADARKLIAAIDGIKLALPSTKLASRLLALTAVRPGVLRLAERKEFHDLGGDQPYWRIPAAKMKLSRQRKTDAKFDFVVPLSRQAVATVRAAMSVGKHPRWLFAGERAEKAISDSTLSQLYLDAGYRGRHVPHGWRATFSTIMNERAAEQDTAGDRAIIELMLAHISGDVEAAYNRAAYMPRRRQIAQQWADLLMQDLPGPETLIRL
jgi:hypothetical protein